MANKVFLAVDLGAGSGRIMAAIYDGKTVTLEEVIPTSDMDSNFRPVKPDDELVIMAKTLGISFGDE